MSNTTKRMFFESLYRIDIHESWFTDMSAKGLHLCKINAATVTFTKGEPARAKYRIDILHSGLTTEQLDTYRECGWTLAASKKDFYVFRGPEDAVELHTDPVVQGYTLDRLNLRLKNLTILSSVLWAAALAMMLYSMFGILAPFISLVESAGIQQYISFLIYLYAIYLGTKAYFAVRRLRNSLAKGIPLNHRANWKTPRRASLIGIAVTVALLIFSITVTVLQTTSMKDAINTRNQPLPEQLDPSLPVVRLRDIENSAELRPYTYRDREGNYHNTDNIHTKWAFTAPVQTEAEEHGVIESMNWEDNSGAYSPSVSTQYYKLISKWIAQGYFSDKITQAEKNTLYIHRGMTGRPIDDDFFDKLYVFERDLTDDVTRQIYALSGNEVVIIRYYGYAETKLLISLLKEKFINR